MRWEQFQFDYRVQLESLHSDLVQIEAYKEAALNLVLPPPWREQLDRLNRIRAVHGTTALEGNPLTEAEVGRQMEMLDEDAPLPPEQSREQQQVRNAARAQQWIRETFVPGGRPIRLSDILRMHQMATQGSDEANNVPGRLRTHSVVVGSQALGGVHRGAPHARLPALMDEFAAFINSRRMQAEHPVVQALLAHFFLVTLHPFGDGNGRVSRLVEAGILFRGAYNVLGFYGLSNYFYQNGDEYKLRLQCSRRSQPFDLSEFVAFGVRGFAAELKGINNFIKTKLNRLVYRDALQRAFNTRVSKRRCRISQREHGLLDFLLQQTEPTDPFADEPSAKLKCAELRQDPYIKAAYANLTDRTFHRELTRLAELGFLKLANGGAQATVEIDFNAISRY